MARNINVQNVSSAVFALVGAVFLTLYYLRAESAGTRDSTQLTFGLVFFSLAAAFFVLGRPRKAPPKLDR